MTPPNWNVLSDAELKSAVKSIIASSNNETQVRRRILAELGYPQEINMIIYIPTTEFGRTARELIRELGGSIMGNGAIVTATMPGHKYVISI